MSGLDGWAACMTTNDVFVCAANPIHSNQKEVPGL